LTIKLDFSSVYGQLVDTILLYLQLGFAQMFLRSSRSSAQAPASNHLAKPFSRLNLWYSAEDFIYLL
jgi:hypothetical protein